MSSEHHSRDASNGSEKSLGSVEMIDTTELKREATQVLGTVWCCIALHAELGEYRQRPKISVVSRRQGIYRSQTTEGAIP